jgi:hypothetical protein
MLRTFQNVLITYELATAPCRILAIAGTIIYPPVEQEDLLPSTDRDPATPIAPKPEARASTSFP